MKGSKQPEPLFKDHSGRPVQSSRYTDAQIEDMRDVSELLGLDLDFLDDDIEISALDRVVWDGLGRPPWRGPGPNFLAEFRRPMTPEEYDAHLDEMAEVIKRSIKEMWAREVVRQKRKAGHHGG